jgi:hypothetical protein
VRGRRGSGARIAWTLLPGAAAALALGLAPPAAADQNAPKTVTCTEKIPAGAHRPEITETFPGQVETGYLARLELVIKHGRGETVLPGGFRVNSGSETARFLEEAGFAAADPAGGAPATKETDVTGETATTKVSIPFVVLPAKSGTKNLTLPQIPVTVSRASGDPMIVCTQLHLVTAVDPTASEKDPAPHPSPPGRPQREDWPLARWVAGGVLIGLVVGALVAWWVRKQLKKPVPEAEPIRRLPWEEAFEEIARLRASIDYAEAPRDDRGGAPAPGTSRAELYDAVSDTVRKYLGARYGFSGLGFDGLETTSDEMMAILKRVRPAVPELAKIRGFLDECDLVKFARVDPTPFACKDALDVAESIVTLTMPKEPPPGTEAEEASTRPDAAPSAAPATPPAAPPPPPPPAPPPAADPPPPPPEAQA